MVLLGEYMNNEITKRDIESIENQLLHIEDIIPEIDRQRFVHYFDKWKTRKNISDVWRDAESIFFPIFFHDNVYDKLLRLSNENIDLLVKLLADIEAPFVLNQIVSTVFDKHNSSICLDILKQAPPIVENVEKRNTDNYLKNYLFCNNITSILAPVTFEILLRDILDGNYRDNDNSIEDYKTHNIDDVSEKDVLDKIFDVLDGRTDGFFIAYHYLKHLLKSERNNIEYYDVLNIISERFKNEAIECFLEKENLIIEGLDNNIDLCWTRNGKCFDKAGLSYELKFTQMGKLSILDLKDGEYEGDVLINFRAIIWMLGVEGNEQLFYKWFKIVFSCQAPSFFTNDSKYYCKHYDIARILLAQKDPVIAWNDVIELMSTALYLSSVRYFGDQEMRIRYHHFFMWNVGLRMLDIYCECASAEYLSSAQELWGFLWKEGTEYIRRFSRFIGDEEYQYLATLLCYYFVYFIRDVDTREENTEINEFIEIAKEEEGVEETECNEEIKKIKQTKKQSYNLDGIIEYFYDIQEQPIICVIAIQTMIDNGLTWDSMLYNRKYVDFFKDIMKKAKAMAEGQYCYRWILKFINRFM